jgi:hypothetical protein
MSRVRDDVSQQYKITGKLNPIYRFIFKVLLLLTANGFIPNDSALECKTGQYNTVQYNKYNNIHHTMQT